MTPKLVLTEALVLTKTIILPLMDIRYTEAHAFLTYKSGLRPQLILLYVLYKHHAPGDFTNTPNNINKLALVSIIQEKKFQMLKLGVDHFLSITAQSTLVCVSSVNGQNHVHFVMYTISQQIHIQIKTSAIWTFFSYFK